MTSTAVAAPVTAPGQPTTTGAGEAGGEEFAAALAAVSGDSPETSGQTGAPAALGEDAPAEGTPGEAPSGAGGAPVDGAAVAPVALLVPAGIPTAATTPAEHAATTTGAPAAGAGQAMAGVPTTGVAGTAPSVPVSTAVGTAAVAGSPSGEGAGAASGQAAGTTGAVGLPAATAGTGADAGSAHGGRQGQQFGSPVLPSSAQAPAGSVATLSAAAPVTSTSAQGSASGAASTGVDTVQAALSTGPLVEARPAAEAARVDAPPAPRSEAGTLGNQVANRIAVFRSAPDGNYSMTVQVTPDELGPVQVHVEIRGGDLDLTLRGAHEHGRVALTEALPELRRYLEAAGVSCNRVQVDADSDTSSWVQGQDAQTNHAERDRQQQQDRRARTWMQSGDDREAPTRVLTDGPPPSGVDVRV